MAERRYGFRFSFAEGGVIAISMIGAAFLIFLFGVYAGRELEARKNAENTRTVRLNAMEKAADSPLGGTVEPLTKKEEGGAPAAFTPPVQETAKTVVVITPPKQNHLSQDSSPPPVTNVASVATPTSTPPLAPPEKESLGKTEVLQRKPSILTRKTATPSSEKSSNFLERKPPTKEIVHPSPPGKSRITRTNWSVQVHATRDERSARQVADRLRNQGYVPIISRIVREGEVWYRVRVGSFGSADEARASVERFRREGKFSQAYPVSN